MSFKSSKPKLRIGLAYDFRTRPGSGVSVADSYAAGLEQIRLADQLGFDHVWFSEHRFLEDCLLYTSDAADE